MYDNICKFLAESYSADFAHWLLGYPLGLTQLSPSELSVEPIRADALMLLAAEDVILHLEFQTQPASDIPFRMADYRLRVFRRYPNKLMRQVVIYLKPTGSELAQVQSFEISGMRHEFEVIRLWEVPTATLVPFPGLLPLTILSRSDDKVQTLQAIARQIATIPNRTEQNNVMAATAVLAGLVLEKRIIQQILREEIVKESVIYQDILQQGWQQGLQEGRQEGRQEGLQEGRQEGRQEGLQEGRQEGELALVLRLMQRRLGAIDERTQARVRSLPLDQLEDLGEALLDFTQLDDLMRWLDSQAIGD